MKKELLEPLKDNALYSEALRLVRRIYRSIDAGRDYAEPLAQLSQLVQRELSTLEMEDAAELIEPDAYAFELVSDRIPYPTDLTYAEMLELVERICANDGSSVQLGNWTRCLEQVTGDKRVSTLLQTPELYFEDGVPRRLSPQEILDTALAAGGKEPQSS